jgi:putative hydrolase of the HAD superfamily
MSRGVHRIRRVTVRAVIFDWGGTLTPWHTVDHAALWRAVCTGHVPAARVAAVALAAAAAERELWELCEREHRSATIHQVLATAGVEASEALLESYVRAWEPHTFTDPEAIPVLTALREDGIRTGVLSNTMWPRAWHEEVFRRDGVLHLFDGAVYTSEIQHTKPHREAFLAAMRSVGVTDPGTCVFVGDRPYDDVYGAKSAGMRAVLIPNSEVPPYDGVRPDAVIGRLSELPPVLRDW